jgi:ABC-2 type transport system permease protein
MSKTLVIARKEIRELFRNRSNLLVGLGFALFFSTTYSFGLARQEINTNISPDSTFFYLSLSIALFMAYVSTAQLFLLEKRDAVIETLMCSPISLRQIWLGKTIAGITLPYSLSIFTVLVITIVASILSHNLVLPGLVVILHIVLVVPTFVAAFVGLVGLGQLLLGMRENRILNLIIFAPAFAALYGSGSVITGGATVSWLYVTILFGVSIIVLGSSAYAARHLSRERIVTTIE